MKALFSNLLIAWGLLSFSLGWEVNKTPINDETGRND